MAPYMQDYKCLCTAVTIFATLFDPKFDLSILAPLTAKSRSNHRHLLHPCPVHPGCKFIADNADIDSFMRTSKTQ